mmetsp:Transcript_104561/g.180174  ORF Transcript_104561/g.180174 Transcript_104561/m.180174 type:complete len:286 (+) Transcript_104561:370-1227(+)
MPPHGHVPPPFVAAPSPTLPALDLCDFPTPHALSPSRSFAPASAPSQCSIASPAPGGAAPPAGAAPAPTQVAPVVPSVNGSSRPPASFVLPALRQPSLVASSAPPSAAAEDETAALAPSFLFHAVGPPTSSIPANEGQHSAMPRPLAPASVYPLPFPFDGCQASPCAMFGAGCTLGVELQTPTPSCAAAPHPSDSAAASPAVAGVRSPQPPSACGPGRSVACSALLAFGLPVPAPEPPLASALPDFVHGLSAFAPIAPALSVNGEGGPPLHAGTARAPPVPVVKQ